MKLAVVGSINADISVTAERIPQKGETVRGSSVSTSPGGKGANQAVAMARLGADVEMFGCVGDDENGRQMLKNLRQEGVGISHVCVLKGVPTGMAMITVGESDNTVVIVAGANQMVDQAYVEAMKEQLKAYDLVVLQQEIPLDAVYDVIDFCWENQIPVVLNPAPAAAVPMEIVDKATYLTPNEHEAKLIFGEQTEMDALLRQYPEKLIITQGEKGVSVCRKSGEILNVPARKSTVVDTTGAGDTLNGAFAVRIAAGDDIESALRYANIAAGLSVEKSGAQGGMPTNAEVEAAALYWRNPIK